MEQAAKKTVKTIDSKNKINFFIITFRALFLRAYLFFPYIYKTAVIRKVSAPVLTEIGAEIPSIT